MTRSINCGLEISIITTARNDDESRQLLQMLGMPFRRKESNGKTCMKYREMRRKYPPVCATAVKSADVHVDISGDSDYAVYVSASRLWKVKFRAS
jgi:hypothetical protein